MDTCTQSFAMLEVIPTHVRKSISIWFNSIVHGLNHSSIANQFLVNVSVIVILPELDQYITISSSLSSCTQYSYVVKIMEFHTQWSTIPNIVFTAPYKFLDEPHSKQLLLLNRNRSNFLSWFHYCHAFTYLTYFQHWLRWYFWLTNIITHTLSVMTQSLIYSITMTLWASLPASIKPTPATHVSWICVGFSAYFSINVLISHKEVWCWTTYVKQ